MEFIGNPTRAVHTKEFYSSLIGKTLDYQIFSNFQNYTPSFSPQVSSSYSFLHIHLWLLKSHFRSWYQVQILIENAWEFISKLGKPFFSSLKSLKNQVIFWLFVSSSFLAEEDHNLSLSTSHLLWPFLSFVDFSAFVELIFGECCLLFVRCCSSLLFFITCLLPCFSWLSIPMPNYIRLTHSNPPPSFILNSPQFSKLLEKTTK